MEYGTPPPSRVGGDSNHSWWLISGKSGPRPAVRIIRGKTADRKTNHEWTRINTNRPEDGWTSFNGKRRQNASALLSRWCDHVMGGSPPGSAGVPPAQILPQLRPSPPPESTGSGALPLLRPGDLLHRNQPAAAPCLCFGRAHAVPAGRAVGCNIAGKLSGNRRDSMRAGRPRSRGCRPDGEVGGIRRATSLKAGLSPLGNSRLPASRAPAPRDWADPSRRTINGTSMHRMHRIIRTGGCCRRR